MASNAKAELEQQLQKFTCTSQYAVGRKEHSSLLPKITIKTETPTELKFPLSDEEKLEIAKLSRCSPVGTATADVVDLSVRKSKELLPDQMSIDNLGEWQAYVMEPILREISDKLQLGSECWEIGAMLYKLLVYEKGSFFARHRDNERIQNMFGTLVITLPSVFEGGVLHVHSPSNCAETCSFSSNNKELPPCRGRGNRGEVDEVTEGSRVALVYNLIGMPSLQRLAKVPSSEWRAAPCRILTSPPQPVDEQQASFIAAAIRRWESEEDADYPDYVPEGSRYGGYWNRNTEHFKPAKLVAVLSHQYTPHSIAKGLVGLKGRDRVVGELLAAARKCTLDPLKATSLRELCVDALQSNAAELGASSTGAAVVQTVVDERRHSASVAQPLIEFDAYLSLAVLWDRGECTPDDPFYTTGPLIPLTDATPVWPALSLEEPCWEPGMFGGNTDEVDEDAMAEFVDSDGEFDDDAYQESIAMQPFTRPRDLFIDPDELLLTDKDAKEEIEQGGHPGQIEKIEFLGNGCPYPGMWYSRAVIVFFPRSHRGQVLLQSKEGKLAEEKRQKQEQKRQKTA